MRRIVYGEPSEDSPPTFHDRLTEAQVTHLSTLQCAKLICGEQTPLEAGSTAFDLFSPRDLASILNPNDLQPQWISTPHTMLESFRSNSTPKPATAVDPRPLHHVRILPHVPS